MNQEPGLTDEVVMIFVDSEIVNDGEALDPVGCGTRVAPRPEWMHRRSAQRALLSRNSQLDKLIAVLWGDGRDRLQLVLACDRIPCPDFVACLDALDGDCAVICMDRRASRETFRAGQPRLGVLKQPSDSLAYANEEQIGQYALNVLLDCDFQWQRPGRSTRNRLPLPSQ